MTRRTIEIFTAGCPCCTEAVDTVEDLACSSCEVVVYDISDDTGETEGRKKAEQYGIKRVPAVVVDGKLASCCANDGVDPDILEQMGVGQP